jgi:hypothetical protein
MPTTGISQHSPKWTPSGQLRSNPSNPRHTRRTHNQSKGYTEMLSPGIEPDTSVSGAVRRTQDSKSRYPLGIYEIYIPPYSLSNGLPWYINLWLGSRAKTPPEYNVRTCPLSCPPRGCHNSVCVGEVSRWPGNRRSGRGRGGSRRCWTCDEVLLWLG